MAEEVKTNYPGNSNKLKAVQAEKARPKVERITTSDVVQRKKPLGRKIAETFSGDDAHSVGSYILFEVLIPAAKNTISDAVSQGIERMLFGDSRPRSSSGGTRTNYSSYHKPGVRRDEPRVMSARGRATHDFNEVVLGSRGEAQEVLDTLTDLVDKYDLATVTDLYELVGITGSFTDDKWGWTDLRQAGVRQVREGYLLDLPRTSPIN